MFYYFHHHLLNISIPYSLVDGQMPHQRLDLDGLERVIFTTAYQLEGQTIVRAVLQQVRSHDED